MASIWIGTRLDTVSTGMSALLDHYPNTTSDDPSPGLTQAISTLCSCGIQVDASKDRLTFRFDESEGFNGAPSRLTEVKRWLSGTDVRARLFLSDSKLLLKFPPEQVLPSGVWEVHDGWLSFIPSYFTRHSLYNDTLLGSDRPLRALVTAQITFYPDESAIQDATRVMGGCRIDIHYGFASDDGIDETRPLPEDAERMLPDKELERMMSSLEETLKELDWEGDFETQSRQGNIAAACQSLETVSCKAISVRTDDWAASGWKYEQEPSVGKSGSPLLRGQTDGGKHARSRADDVSK